DRDFRAEAYHVDRQEEPLNERLLEALKDAASPFDTVRFHYSDFEEKYGATIFGGKRPADALNLMKPLMEKEGYSLVVKQVKIDKKVSRGFVISPVGEMEQLPVCVWKPSTVNLVIENWKKVRGFINQLKKSIFLLLFVYRHAG
ncbi:MAG: hypothetical protein PUE91_07415, partial [Clostridiales bacterium]|nr:hypothetical protein [Clostridiales bacterium]